MAAKELLKGTYLFKEFNNDELQNMISACDEKSYSAGDTIFSQSDVGDALFVIRIGTVKVFNKGKDGEDVQLSQLSTGAHFGEVSFFDGGKRYANVEAVEHVEAIRIDYEKAKKILSQHPDMASKFYKALAGFLCGRLRVTNNDLSFAREKMAHHF